MNPFLALFITLVVALVEIRALDFAAQRGWIESRLSRKLIHILTGPLFVLCWLLFPAPDLWYYRWLAALVPLLFTVQFALIGLGMVKDEASVKAMSPQRGPARDPARSALLWHHLCCHDAGLLEGFSHRHDGRDVDVRRRWPGRHHGTRA